MAYPSGEDFYDLRTQVEEMKVPVCLHEAQERLLASIDDSIGASTISLTAMDRGKQKMYLDRARKNLEEFYREIERVNSCKPICW